MYDILRYRIPGESPVEKQGSFKKLERLNGFSGFIVSDFDQRDLYGFEEGKSSQLKAISSVLPYVMLRNEYEDLGAQFLKHIISNDLGKAIFSRVKRLPFSKEKQSRIFEDLCLKYPNAFVYEISSGEFGHWIGATPEILLKGTKDSLDTVALAATKKADDQMPWGEKEISEQKMVSDFIEDCLLSSHATFEKSITGELTAGPVKHLLTRFHISKVVDPIGLVERLHPTPAVSGFPRDQALELIKKLEPHNRGLYTGFIGLMNERFELFVNLRCAQIIGEEIFIYVGGGYTNESVVVSEWHETENKAKTLSEVIENL